MSAAQVKRSSGNHTNNCSTRKLCASSWRRKKIISLLLVVRVHVAQTGIRARQDVRARVCVWKKTYITAAVRQLLFRVKTERNLKLKSYCSWTKGNPPFKVYLAHKTRGRSRVSCPCAMLVKYCKYGQNCARMRLCCPYSKIKIKIKYFNCS